MSSDQKATQPTAQSTAQRTDQRDPPQEGELNAWSPHPIYYHEDFLSLDEAHKKRAYFLIQRLRAEGRAPFKGTQGVNQGWRRSQLEGNHVYLWWAPRGAPPLKGQHDKLPPRSVVVRGARHHDETDQALSTGDLERDYSTEGMFEELGEPWREEQAQFIGLRDRVAMLLGTPGTGKTTTLWGTFERAHVPHKGPIKRALYVTWSKRLAEGAERMLSLMNPHESELVVRSSLDVFAELLGGVWRERLPEARELMRWGRAERAFLELCDERVTHHAYKRTLASKGRLMYELTRAWVIGREPWEGKRALEPLVAREGVELQEGLSDTQKAWDLVIAQELKLAQELDKHMKVTEEDELCFAPELVFARAALKRLQDSSIPLPEWCVAEALLIDEIQDLTPLEVEVFVTLLRRLESDHQINATLRVAGDEGQVLRPTYFAWRELKQQLYGSLASVEERALEANLRCPPEVVAVLDELSQRYEALPAYLRPKAQRLAQERADELKGEVGVLEMSEAEAIKWLTPRAQGVELVLLYLSDEPPEWALSTSELRDYLMSPAEAKGLEFKQVILLNLSAALKGLTQEVAEQDPLTFFLRLNELRVAVSRSTERLIALELEGASEETYELMSSALRGELESLDEAQRAPQKRKGASPKTTTQEELTQKLKVQSQQLKAQATEAQSEEERVGSLLEKAERDLEGRPASAWRALMKAEALIEGAHVSAEELSDQLTSLKRELLNPERSPQALHEPLSDHTNAQLHALKQVMGALSLNSELTPTQAQEALKRLDELTPPPLWLRAELSAQWSALRSAYWLARAELRQRELLMGWLALTEADRVKFEAERLEAERLEAERLEAERLEAERLEAKRLEAERLEAKRLEAERLEAARLEAARLKAERINTLIKMALQPIVLPWKALCYTLFFFFDLVFDFNLGKEMSVVEIIVCEVSKSNIRFDSPRKKNSFAKKVAHELTSNDAFIIILRNVAPSRKKSFIQLATRSHLMPFEVSFEIHSLNLPHLMPFVDEIVETISSNPKSYEAFLNGNADKRSKIIRHYITRSNFFSLFKGLGLF